MKLLLLILSLFFTGSSLDKQVGTYLSKKLTGYEKIEYVILNSPDQSSKVELQDGKPLNINRNMVYIPVTIFSSDKSSSSSFLSVRVKLFKRVLVANQNVKPKTQLDYSMFNVQLIDVAAVNGKAIDNTENVFDLRAKSFLNKGEVLTEEETEQLPILFSGDEVTAVKIVGSVTVTVQAFAREDGCEGERIKIKTVGNKQFTAKVVNKHEVLIEE